MLHNIPTDFITSWQWTEEANVKHCPNVAREMKTRKTQKKRREKTERSLLIPISVLRSEADALHSLPRSSLLFSRGKSPDLRVPLKTTRHRFHPTSSRNADL
jgi:hypothetical protein